MSNKEDVCVCMCYNMITHTGRVHNIGVTAATTLNKDC